LIVAVTVNSLFLAEKGADVLVCWASSICTKYKSSLLPIVHWEYILLKVEQCTAHVTLTFRESLGFVGIHMQSYVIHSKLVLLLLPFLLFAACSTHYTSEIIVIFDPSVLLSS
jgi:hypothetical protein